MNPRIVRFFSLLVVLGLSSPLSAAQWDDMAIHDSVVYFAFSSPLVIQRYDMATETFLTSIGLTSSPTALTVDADAIYVSYVNGKTVRIQHDGGGETVLLTTFPAAEELLLDGDFLFVTLEDKVWNINKNTGAQIDMADYFYKMVGHSIAPSVRSFFALRSLVSPPDIVRVDYDSQGNLLEQDDSPYHGDFPGASRTWILPGETFVVDNSATVYRTSDLIYERSLGGPFDNLASNENAIVVSRDAKLYRYSLALIPAGTLELTSAPDELSILDGTIYLFRNGTGADLVEVELVNLEDVVPAEPGDPVDPVGLAYEPDQIELGNDGMLYLLSAEHRSVFRWNTTTESYEETIPLAEAPILMSYSGVTNTLYLAQDSGVINQIKLDQTTAEQFFAISPQTPLAIATASQYVFVCDPVFDESHFTYHPDGSLISQAESRYFSVEFTWSATNSRIYHFRDNSTPNDLLWEVINEDGTIGNQMDSPYHSSAGIQHPIRVKPDGSVVLLGSGRVYDAISLELIDQLSNSISDAAWLDGTLYTIRSVGGNTELQSWFPTYTEDKSWIVPGMPKRLFTVGNKLMAVTMVDGIPFIGVVPVTVVVPTVNLTVFRGSQVSGTVADLAESDDSRMIFNPALKSNQDEAPLWLFFDATLPNDSPSYLSFFIESQASTPGLTMTIESFNFNAGDFDVLGSEAAVFNSDAVVTFDITSGISDYVDNGGTVLSRVGWRQTGPAIQFPWEVRIDQVAWVEE